MKVSSGPSVAKPLNTTGAVVRDVARRILLPVLSAIAGYIATAYVLALSLPTDTMAALPTTLTSPLAGIGGVVSGVAGAYLARRF